MNHSYAGIAGRIPGLDTLRAAAIVLVLLYHYMVVVSGQATFGVITEIGWAGVDLFFVLSGYLIGNQIMGTLARGERLALGNFYARRFLRTLPNYYIVLALYFIFPIVMSGKMPGPLWRFLSFTQNFGLQAGTPFTHSWSLNIEEQFYLVLPALALLFAATGKSVRWAWAALGAAMLCAMLVRGWMWLECQHNGGSYMTSIYYSTVCRADELLPGVALAMLKNFHGDLYVRLQKFGNVAFAVGVISICLMLTLFYVYIGDDYVSAHGYNLLLTVLGYPALALAFALLVFAALCTDCWLNRVRVPGAASLALWSYAIYLAHKPLYFIGRNLLTAWGWDVNEWTGILAILSLGVAGGWVLYWVVEVPFMRIRERYFPMREPFAKVDGLRAWQFPDRMA